MSNQDRAAKARDKAFKKASAHMAANCGGVYETSEDYAWNLIWDRALRYADKWWDKQLEEVRGHLEKARGNAVLLSLDLNQAREAGVAQADEVTRLRIENDRLRGHVQNQVTFLRGSRESAARLRRERDELKVAMAEMADKVHSESFDEVLERNGVQARFIEDLSKDLGEARRDLEAKERALRLASLRIANLSRRLDTCQAQLNEARALTTQGTTTVFEENERLVAEVRRLTSLLADEEERVSQRDDKIFALEALNESLKGFNEDCMRKRDELLTILAEEKTLTGELRREAAMLRDRLLDTAPSRIEYGVPPCNHTWIAEGYRHTCTEPRGHNFMTPGGHRCHCRAQ